MVEKLEKVLKVKNEMGLHMRPASYIANILKESQSKVTLTYKGQSVNARSLMSIMILAVPKNAQVRISIEGSDAGETMKRLEQAFEGLFGEKGD